MVDWSFTNCVVVGLSTITLTEISNHPKFSVTNAMILFYTECLIEEQNVW